MTYKSRLITAIATGAVLLNALAPLALADTVTVTGNGAFSNNAANLSNNSSTVVSQTNNANVTNNVKTDQNTGNNTSDFNTGGNTIVKTGDANSSVNVSNALNLNKASVDCGCNNSGNTTVNISGNGAYSANGADVNNSNNVVLSQNNSADVNNKVDTKQYTGNNDAGFNTGGDTIVKSGDANSNVTVSTAANANVAQVGGGNGGAGNGSSVIIKDNGAFSENGVDLSNNNSVVLSQENDAYIDNNIKTKQDTGNNSADFNTGGRTFLMSGNANSNTTVDNLVNFNAADLNCGCVLGGTDVKVAANGAFSDNGLNVDNSNVAAVVSANESDLLNNIDNKGKTGNNDVSFSTGNVTGDPTVWTGDSNSSTDVMNSGNVNLLNQGNPITLPGGLGLSLSFDMSSMMGSFMGLL